MLHEVDEALQALIATGALAGGEVEVVFEAPTREWAARRNIPTISTYLYDVREDVGRRERGPGRIYGEDGRVTGYRQPPRFFRLSYLVTAWTKRPQDEHRLLAAVLGCLVRNETLPTHLLPPGGILASTGLGIPVTVAMPQDSRSITDIWSALGGQLKPALDVVVIAPLPVSPEYDAGPPAEAVELSVRDTAGRAGPAETIGPVSGGAHRKRHPVP
jgi:hypothetical protein